MSRPKSPIPFSKANITLPENVKKMASRHAFKLGFPGGLSELIARLLVAELATGKIAQAYDRNLTTANS